MKLDNSLTRPITKPTLKRSLLAAFALAASLLVSALVPAMPAQAAVSPAPASAPANAPASYTCLYYTVKPGDQLLRIAIRFGKRIFQPFYRLDDSITAPSGTGLGLTIARAAAKRHGGGLELLPSQCGARFRLWLRVRVDSSDLHGVEA